MVTGHAEATSGSTIEPIARPRAVRFGRITSGMTTEALWAADAVPSRARHLANPRKAAIRDVSEVGHAHGEATLPGGGHDPDSPSALLIAAENVSSASPRTVVRWANHREDLVSVECGLRRFGLAQRGYVAASDVYDTDERDRRRE